MGGSRNVHGWNIANKMKSVLIKAERRASPKQNTILNRREQQGLLRLPANKQDHDSANNMLSVMIKVGQKQGFIVGTESDCKTLTPEQKDHDDHRIC